MDFLSNGRGAANQTKEKVLAITGIQTQPTSYHRPQPSCQRHAMLPTSAYQKPFLIATVIPSVIYLLLGLASTPSQYAGRVRLRSRFERSLHKI